MELNEKMYYNNVENNNLKEELKKYLEENENITKKHREIQFYLNTTENSQLPLQFELSKITREKDQCYQQLKLVENELNTKTFEWTNQKQNLISKCNEFEAELTTEKIDNNSKTQQIISLQVNLIYIIYVYIHYIIIIIVILKKIIYIIII